MIVSKNRAVFVRTLLKSVCLRSIVGEMLREAWNYLNSFEFGTPDPITNKLPLVGTPWQVFIVNAAYLLFVFKLGPAFMRNRPAYNIKNILLVYNLIQVILNLIIPICAYVMIVQYRVYNIRCMIALPIDHKLKVMEITCFYIYYLVKFFDFFDTIFFVLRKNFRQITFLHVYHHVMMATAGYLYFRYYGPGGHISMMGILNAVVHCFMYFYYFTSVLNSSMKNSIWWKKYITRLQLTQFVIIFIHNLYPLLFVPNCKSPRIMTYFAMLQSFIMLVLFGNFYKKTYLVNGKNISTKTENND